MIEKHSDTKPWMSKNLKNIGLTWTMLLFLLKPAVSKNNEQLRAELMDALKITPISRTMPESQIGNNSDNNNYSFNKVPNTLSWWPDAFTYALDNVGKYYPDMKNHLTTMLNSFWDQEHKDTTLALLNTMITNITDPAQKTGAIIWALEYSVFYKSVFWDKYGDKITEQNLKYVDKFDSSYKARFKRYYARLIAETERLKKELAKSQNKLKTNQQKLDWIVNKFSPEDIKKIPWMKARILGIQKIYEEEKLPISLHTQSLFYAAR